MVRTAFTRMIERRDSEVVRPRPFGVQRVGSDRSKAAEEASTIRTSNQEVERDTQLAGGKPRSRFVAILSTSPGERRPSSEIFAIKALGQ